LSGLHGQLVHINHGENSRAPLKTDIGSSARLSTMLIRIQLSAPAAAAASQPRESVREAKFNSHANHSPTANFALKH